MMDDLYGPVAFAAGLWEAAAARSEGVSSARGRHQLQLDAINAHVPAMYTVTPMQQLLAELQECPAALGCPATMAEADGAAADSLQQYLQHGPAEGEDEDGLVAQLVRRLPLAEGTQATAEWFCRRRGNRLIQAGQLGPVYWMFRLARGMLPDGLTLPSALTIVKHEADQALFDAEQQRHMRLGRDFSRAHLQPGADEPVVIIDEPHKLKRAKPGEGLGGLPSGDLSLAGLAAAAAGVDRIAAGSPLAGDVTMAEAAAPSGGRGAGAGGAYGGLASGEEADAAAEAAEAGTCGGLRPFLCRRVLSTAVRGLVEEWDRSSPQERTERFERMDPAGPPGNCGGRDGRAERRVRPALVPVRRAAGCTGRCGAACGGRGPPHHWRRLRGL